ncbi:MAG: VCBS repeat-containing protein [Phycisphaerae bacterium]|nr:VCBS repeat-containing protein [Phycisphaerae bacterium]
MNQFLQSPFTAMASLGALILLGAGAAFGQGIPTIHEVVPPLGAGMVDQVGLHTVRLSFSESVTIVPGAIRAWGVAGGAISLSTSWNAAANELTVTFDPAITAERVTLLVGPGVTGEFGDELDGEIPNPMFPTIPTGDGLPGGVAVFRWDVLQGDANRDGVTNSADAQAVLAALGTCGIEPLADPDFDADADLNADGCVNVLDVQILLGGLGGTLPPLDGAPPVIASIGRDTGEPLTEDLSDLTITMSEAIVADGVVPTCVRMRSLDGELILPVSTALLADERTIACHFDPPLSSCGDYAVLLSSSIVDLSGEFFVAAGAAPGFTGSTPPPTPALNSYPSATAGAGVTLSGTIPDLPGFASAAEIRVQGIDQVVTAPVAGSTFSITVPLKANHVNLLYVSAISPCGIAGAPVTAEVSRDSEPPSLAVLYPVDGETTFDAAISVGGFVGDTLIGFEGLNVSVNGQPAIVDIGSGQLGTWVLPSLSLREGGPTQLVVTASDALGNTATKTISVTRQATPRNAAIIEKLSGDGQIGDVAASLAQPIRVKVWKADGSPWANKVVDFKVTQNDGRLDGNGVAADAVHFQSLTDASGEASAAWTLGSSSGCGNNRVEVTSKDVVGAITFSATALAGAADQINIGTGDGQRIETGGVAPLPLSAWVSDSRNPVAGVPVTFTVVGGNGTVNGAGQATVASDATGHAEVSFTAGTTPGANRVRATFPGNATNPAVFTVYGIARDITRPTSFKGLVFDNASQPIGNVKVTLKFQDHFVGPVLSNAQGQFEFPSIEEDGAVHVMVEGFLANKLNGKPLPPGVKFPSLGYDTVIIPNAENSLGRPVLLPPLLPENARVWDGQSDIELTCGGVDGLKYIVKANSMTLVNGSHPTPGAPVTLSINQVHHNAVPMPLPDGASPPFDATFYPPGATFDPPVAVEYPNMSAIPPGAAVHFLTFNHDTGEFEAMAPGRVSEDGSTIRSEPGTGLTKSGWHGPGLPILVTTKCISMGYCVPVEEGADAAPPARVFVNGRCIDSFTSFQVRPNYLSTRMEVEIFTVDPDATVAWSIDVPSGPGGGSGGFVAPWEGTEKTFSIKPVIEASHRELGGLHSIENAPVKYVLTIDVTSGDRTETIVRTIKQDKRAILQQEYVDYYWFGGSNIYPPSRSLFGAPLGIQGFNSHEFNKGNYTADGGLVLNGFMQQIAYETKEKYQDTIILNSAYRDPQRNKAVGGVVNSIHQLGGAVDMVGSPNSTENKANLYRAAVNAALDGGTAEVVMLEKNGKQLLPSLWMIPPHSVTFTGTYQGAPYSVECWDTTYDSLPDFVLNVTPANLPTSLLLHWAGGGSSNLDFYIGGAGPIKPGDPLYVKLTPYLWDPLYEYIGPSLDAIFTLATHIHADKPGVPAVSDAEDDEGASLLSPWTFSGGGQSVETGPAAAFVLENVGAGDMWGPGGPGTPADGVSDSPIQLVGQQVVNGITRYAYTLPFYVTDGATQIVPELVVLDVPPLMPVSIAVTGPDTLMVGESGAVTVIAKMNDGTTRDVTSSEEWTTYVTSNPAVATVDPNGVITGQKTGVAFVTATSGSSSTTLRILVLSELLPTTVVGVVTTEAGDPFGGAVVSSGFGTTAVSAADGSFSIEAMVPSRASGTTVSAAATIRGQTYSGSSVALIVPNGYSDAGQIVLTPSSLCDAAWVPAFGGRPLSGEVNAFAVFDDGTGPALYAGGQFNAGSSEATIYLAKLIGNEWVSVGNGLNGPVTSLVVHDDGAGEALFVGGTFTSAGGVAASRIARWDGNGWSAVGGGMDFPIRSMTVFDAGDGAGPRLIAGGDFTIAGGIPANRIARWDGASWSPLGAGANGSVLTLLSCDIGSGQSLYVGGSFTSPGSRIARWDGAGWSGLGAGISVIQSTGVNALAAFDEGSGPVLFVGGSFNFAAGQKAHGIARWNGSAWSPVASSHGQAFAGDVKALAVMDDGSGAGATLFAGGSFSAGSGIDHLARWDGSAWTAVGDHSFVPVTTLATVETGAGVKLAVGQQFDSTLLWDGANWSVPTPGFNGEVSELIAFNDGPRGLSLYALGSFTAVGGQPASRVARWDGQAWHALGTGLNGPATAAAVFDDGRGGGPMLYVGGRFGQAGGVLANNIARWDGMTWTAVGGSGFETVGQYGGRPDPPTQVQELCVFNDGTNGPKLVATGFFDTVDGAPMSFVAAWDGTAWAPLGSGLNYEGRALAAWDDGTGEALYVGGNFSLAGGSVPGPLARWDGQGWFALPESLDGSIEDLEVFLDVTAGQSVLLAAGNFSGTTRLVLGGLGRFNGRSWSWVYPGGPFPGAAYALEAAETPEGPVLFVTGSFTFPRLGITNAAMLSGITWAPMGDGASLNGATTLEHFDDGSGAALYVGGAIPVGPAGDSFMSKWGCAAPPQGAVAQIRKVIDRPWRSRGADRIVKQLADLHLKPGDSLLLGDETRRYGSVVAEAGSTIRLTSPDSHLIVTNLTVEPGATFEWLGGTIEIDGGAWLHPYEITVGCDLDARLVLHSGAFVRAPRLLVCELGSLVGEGVVDAFVQNGGAIAGEDSGLRLLGGYAQEPTGTIIASAAELDAVVAGRAHACSAVDALPFTSGLARRQLVDVDGDGDLDLVRSIGTSEEPIVVLWLDQGDGHFGSPVLCQSERAMALVAIVDANGDGLLDLQLSPRDGGSDITLLAGGEVEVTR